MEQTRALNALEPYLALAKTATAPRAAAEVITQATAASGTYVFTELLQIPNIQNLRNSEEYSPYLNLLEIFAWGNLDDYRSQSNNAPNYPTLTGPQLQKLRLLTLLPLAHSHHTLTYASLKQNLDLPTTRDLEQLITTAIYSGLVTATLDPAHQLLSVTSISPLRDLAPGSVPQLQQKLQDWSARCDSAVAELEQEVLAIKAQAVQREKLKRKKEAAMAAVEAEWGGESGGGQGRKRGIQDGVDLMEIDEQVQKLGRGQRRAAAPTNFGGSGKKLG